MNTAWLTLKDIHTYVRSTSWHIKCHVNPRLLACYAVSTGRLLSMFQRIVQPPTSGLGSLRATLLGLRDPQNGSNMLLRNVSNHYQSTWRKSQRTCIVTNTSKSCRLTIVITCLSLPLEFIFVLCCPCNERGMRYTTKMKWTKKLTASVKLI